MALGKSLGILQAIKEVTKDATPQYKLEPYGMLASLKMAHSPGVIKADSGNGHLKDVKIKYKKRSVVADTSDEASCEMGSEPAYTEQSVSIANVRRTARHIPNNWIQALDEYAMDAMYEVMDTLFIMANGILQATNRDLVTLALANLGKNRSTGSTAAVAVNIAQDSTVNNLGDGPNRILTDFRRNTFTGKPIVVGGGNFEAFMLQQNAKVPGFNGIDTRIQAGGFDFFPDYNVGDIASSANKILVYEKDAIQLVEFMENKGFNGKRHGVSNFGTLVLPMQVGDQLVPVEFDYQFRENDCDVEENSVVYSKGTNLILSKRFGLYTLPTDAYQSTDPLTGNRGSLSYVVSNT